jgi:hypothetical protein
MNVHPVGDSNPQSSVLNTHAATIVPHCHTLIYREPAGLAKVCTLYPVLICIELKFAASCELDGTDFCNCKVTTRMF